MENSKFSKFLDLLHPENILIHDQEHFQILINKLSVDRINQLRPHSHSAKCSAKST